MENEVCKKENDNVYLNIIDKCFSEIKGLRNKLNFITNPNLKSETGTPARTELEGALDHLLHELKELREDVVS